MISSSTQILRQENRNSTVQRPLTMLHKPAGPPPQGSRSTGTVTQQQQQQSTRLSTRLQTSEPTCLPLQTCLSGLSLVPRLLRDATPSPLFPPTLLSPKTGTTTLKTRQTPLC